MELIDLTMLIHEGMMCNRDHPRAPVLWTSARHEITQNFFHDSWKPEENFPILYDGLPDEARTPGSGHGWQSQQMIIGTHMGTHIDSALHFDHRPGAQDAADIPLEKCYGDAVLLDLTSVYAHNHKITMAELDEAEERTGTKVKPDDIVIIRTGHAERYAYGPQADADKFFTCFPGLDYDAGKWFIDREVKSVGTDTINLDCNNYVVAAHLNFLLREWVGKEPIQIYENLMNLDKIPVPRFTFIGFPLPIKDGDGSPVRAVAVVH